jgi:hypothetical protein
MVIGPSEPTSDEVAGEDQVKVEAVGTMTTRSPISSEPLPSTGHGTSRRSSGERMALDTDHPGVKPGGVFARFVVDTWFARVMLSYGEGLDGNE